MSSENCSINLLKFHMQIPTYFRSGKLLKLLKMTNFSIHILHTRLTALILHLRNYYHLILACALIVTHLRKVTCPKLVQKRAGMPLSFHQLHVMLFLFAFEISNLALDFSVAWNVSFTADYPSYIVRAGT